MRYAITVCMILALLLCMGCRRSEYYHPSASEAQSRADYADCTAQADRAQDAAGGEMAIADYTAMIRACMESRGYVYTD